MSCLPGFDKTVTILTPRDVDGGLVYDIAVVQGVSWKPRLKAVAGTSTATFANVFKVRIPDTAVCAKTYAARDHFTDPATQYTITRESRILLGDGAELPQDIAKQERYLAKQDNAFVVHTIVDNRHAGLLPHIYLEGA